MIDHETLLFIGRLSLLIFPFGLCVFIILPIIELPETPRFAAITLSVSAILYLGGGIGLFVIGTVEGLLSQFLAFFCFIGGMLSIHNKKAQRLTVRRRYYA